MKRSLHFPKWSLAVGVTLALVAGFGSITRKKERSIGDKQVSDETFPAAGSNLVINYQWVYDRLPTCDTLLISKDDPQITADKNLWIRDSVGNERLIAKKVTEAKFSPDGNKIAYVTADNEVFVETLAGERLAEIPRASDPSWGVESTTLSFVATPSLEYPELQQQTIYDLNTASIVNESEAKTKPEDFPPKRLNASTSKTK